MSDVRPRTDPADRAPEMPAGYYDDGSGIAVFWDGTKWAPIASPPGDAQAAPPPPADRRRRVMIPLWAAVSAVVVSLFLSGGIVGANGASTQRELESQIAAISSDRDAALQDAASAGEQLEKAGTDLAGARSDNAALQTNVDGLTAQVASSVAQIADRDATIASLKAQISAAGAPPATTPTAPQPPSTGSAYYENCDAARAAGAAPVHVGDPGYSRKLDRDGDGVGCE